LAFTVQGQASAVVVAAAAVAADWLSSADLASVVQSNADTAAAPPKTIPLRPKLRVRLFTVSRSASVIVKHLDDVGGLGFRV